MITESICGVIRSDYGKFYPAATIAVADTTTDCDESLETKRSKNVKSTRIGPVSEKYRYLIIALHEVCYFGTPIISQNVKKQLIIFIGLGIIE